MEKIVVAYIITVRLKNEQSVDYMKNIKIFLISVLTVIVTIEALFVFVLPAFLNGYFESGGLKTFLKEKTGLEFTCDYLKVKTYPSFSAQLSAGGLTLEDSDKNIILKSKDLSVSAWLPSLLLKKLTLKSASAKDFGMKLSRNEDKKFYLGTYPLNLDFDPKKDVNLDIKSLKIDNMRFVFDDSLINQKTDLRIASSDISYRKNKSLKIRSQAGIWINNKKKTDIDINFESRLPVEKSLQKGKTICNATISNLDLSDFSKYLGYLLNQEVVSASGVVNAKVTESPESLDITSSLKNFDVSMKNPLDSIRSESEVKLNSKIKFKNKNLEIEDLLIESPHKSKGWKADITGNITNFATDGAKLNLAVKVIDSDVYSMYWLVPTLAGDETFVMQKFKKYGAWGKANGTIILKGTAKKPEIYGDLTATDVYIVKDNPLVEHCKIYAKFLNDKVYVKTRVFAGYGEYVDIEGTAVMKIYGEGEFKVVSSKNVDLGTAEYMLVPIHEVVGFDIGPVPYMTINGKGNIDLTTRGTVLDGEAFGQFNFMNTTATLEGLNTVLDKANGTLDFNGKDMHFYTKSARINNQPVKVDGKANLNGNIDFDITSNSIDLKDLFSILTTSSILESQKSMVAPVESVSGKVSTAIKVKGVVKDFGDVLKDNKLDISGVVNLTDSKGRLKLAPLTAEKLKGRIEFAPKSWKTALTGAIGTAKIVVNGHCNNGKTDLTLDAAALKTDEILKELAVSSKGNFPQLPLTHSYLSFNGRYKSDKPEFDVKNITANGAFKPYPDAPKVKDFVISSGSFSLSRGNLTVKNFNAKLFNSKILVDGNALGFFSKTPVINGRLNLSSFDISAFNTIKNMPVLPPYIKSLLNAYENYEGAADANVTCRHNNLYGKINLRNIKFNHSFFKTPISVERGDILLDGQKITMHSLIAQVDNNPVFLNLSVKDLDKTMKLNGYFTTKLTEQFVNKYINSLLTYPVKPKGDITVTTDISGDINNLRIRPKLKFAQDADIYYMGANLGDEDEQREINADITINDGNVYFLRNFVYKRFITSQNDRLYSLPVISANGVFNRKNNGFYIKNLNVETLNNTNVKMFNVVFKKSVLKNGIFNCKLNIKGNIDNPAVQGTIRMSNLEMPLYDTLLKSVDVKFQGKSIYVKADGSAMGSDFTLNSVSQNKIKPPIVIDKLDIKSKKINLDTFIDSLTKIPTPNTVIRLVGNSTGAASNKLPLNIADFQIKNGSMSADEISISDLIASNYSSAFSLGSDMVLKLDKLAFDVTTGNMQGTALYDFSNGRIKANVSAFNVDSNRVASSLFGFKDQIFGSANGNIAITTHGSSEEERIKNMFGYVYFEVADGKMPKLGSVEYLLKAGNLIKSGITGANLNNLLDLIAPIKTGYFDSIKGSFTLKNGVAQNIEVYSKGDNLNMYINGEFDVLQNYANLRVFGRLTRRATNILGPVGNLSFNTLLNAIPGIKLSKSERRGFIKDLNKIPGVELDDKQYRVFTVKVDGKIDEDKYVKNFRWIE